MASIIVFLTGFTYALEQVVALAIVGALFLLGRPWTILTLGSVALALVYMFASVTAALGAENPFGPILLAVASLAAGVDSVLLLILVWRGRQTRPLEL